MTDSTPGIVAVGAYAPSLRIEASELEAGWGQFKARNISEKAVPDADEDALTMAYEAGWRALDASAVDPASIDRLIVATTTPPLEEEDVTSHLGLMLGLGDGVAGELYTGSTAAGLLALRTALQADTRTLVIASDCPVGTPDDALEHAAGGGAAAFVLTESGEFRPTALGTHAAPNPGTRFREAGSETLDSLDVTAYERQAMTDVLGAAAGELEIDADEIEAATVHAPDGATPYRLAGVLGVDRETVGAGTVVDELGDAGAAGVPLGMAAALENGVEKLLAAAYGSGGKAVVGQFDGGDAVATNLALDGDRYLSFAEYIRRRGDVTSGAPEGGGGYISIPTWQRSIRQRYRLEAGRCPACDSLNFPPTGACSTCRDLVEYEPVELDRSGHLEALSVISQGGAPPEFAELQAKYGGSYATGIVAFDSPDGETASVPAFVVGTDHEELAIGDSVRATMRRIYTQEGVTRYGFKVEPSAAR